MSEYNTYMTMAPANPAVEAVKKTGGSVLFLIATITYTVILLLTLVSAFMPTTSPYADLLYEMTYDYSVYEITSAASTGSIVGALIGSIPNILLCIGLWMIYGACKTKNPRVSTGGFSMVSGINIFYIVMMSIFLALVCIIMVVASLAVYEASSWSYYGMSAAESVIGVTTTALIVIFALILLVFVLAIIYYAKLVGSIRVIKKAANGIVAGKKISLFVIVINFISIGFSLISLIANLLFFSWLSLLSSLLGIIFNVLITIALVQIRGKLNRIALEHAMDNTMSGTGAYTNYNTGAYENYNTGSYNNFNTGSVPPVQPQYEQPQQPQAPQYGQPQQYQAPQYGQPQQYQAPQYGQSQQYQQPGGYQYQQPQQQAPQQNPQDPWNNQQ